MSSHARHARNGGVGMSGTGMMMSLTDERIDHMIVRGREFCSTDPNSEDGKEAEDLLRALEQLKALRSWAAKVIEVVPSLEAELFWDLASAINGLR